MKAICPFLVLVNWEVIPTTNKIHLNIYSITIGTKPYLKTKKFRPKYNTKTTFSQTESFSWQLQLHGKFCTVYCKINIDDFQMTPLVNVGLARCTYLINHV